MIIQSEFQFADTEVVNQIRENPYLQYFVGLPSYKDEKPFEASSMVHFRKRLSSEILIEINELILKPIEEGADDSQTDDNDNSDDKDAWECALNEFWRIKYTEWNRTNLSYCKELGIRLSSPSLGKSKKDQKVNKKQEYTDNCDRVEVERGFRLAKRKFGLKLIRTRLEETSLCVIALSILTIELNP